MIVGILTDLSMTVEDWQGGEEGRRLVVLAGISVERWQRVSRTGDLVD